MKRNKKLCRVPAQFFVGQFYQYNSSFEPYKLALFQQLGISGSEIAVIGATNFLTQRQSSDGSWEEDAQVADAAPPWAKPGDLAARLYLTANCGFWLALSGNPDNRASKAADYLETYLDPDGHLPSFFHTHWLAGGLWHKLNRQASIRVFDYLSQRTGDLAASNPAWLATTLCLAGVPRSHHLLVSAVSLLEQSQKDDGHWESEDGPSQNVNATLEAINALRLCRT